MLMNQVIQERRRALGFTQEQVADYLGVSTPAVSKWEKGTTSLDVGILPRLARLLKIDLNTLFSFQEELTLQEIGTFCNELSLTAEKDIHRAFKMAEEKIHEFLHNEELLLNSAIILDVMLLQTEIEDNEKEEFDKKIADWYSGLMKSNDEKISNSAKYIVISRYIRQEQLELAQSVLDTIPDKEEMFHAIPNKLMLQVSIYLKQEKADLAAMKLEKELYQVLNRVQMLLYELVDAELSAGENEIAAKIAEQSQKMTEVFELWEYSGYVAKFQILSEEKEADCMIDLLEKILEALKEPHDFSKTSFFYRMAPEMKPIETKQILNTLLNGLENDSECTYLRENPKFQNLIEKYNKE